MVGGQQLLVILVIVLILFGGSKLPALARSLGAAQSEFKRGLREGADDEDEDEDRPAESA
jgi:sec-independent protein translocase protein TatA